MKTFKAVKPKGPSIGFKVSGDEQQVFNNLYNFLNDDEAFLCFARHEFKSQTPEFWLFQYIDNILATKSCDIYKDMFVVRSCSAIICQSDSELEQNGFYIEGDEVYSEVEEFQALEILGRNPSDILNEVYQYLCDNNIELDAFNFDSCDAYSLSFNDGYNCDSFTQGDILLIVNDQTIEVHSRTSLKDDGYIVEDDF